MSSGESNTESKVIDGVEILWDTSRGTMESIGRRLVALWLDPSLLSVLKPLRDELGTELFQLLVADSASHGAEADYESMVTVFADTFEEGFLAWGKAVGVVGWGRFELPFMDTEAGKATVIIRDPWELAMQERVEESWGCPVLRGKMIGIFRYALGVNCWADERCYVENGESVVELSLYQSTMTIATELKRLRAEVATSKARKLQETVEHRTELHQRSEERLRATLASMNSLVFTLDREGVVQSHHGPTETGSDPQGRTFRDLLPADAAERMERARQIVMAESTPQTVDYVIEADGTRRCFSASVTPLRNASDDGPIGVTAVVHDVTSQRQAEEKRTQLEAQLRQAQKMEAIGQLTGGVAHDFNNLLTAIYGNLEMALTESPSDSIRECIDNTLGAAKSAAALTHQLLAFSRRQPLRPRRVDPRTLVKGMEMLIRRTLGERYEVELIVSAGQWSCEVDSSQLESALLNLAINARDSMPDGGKITIETSNARIDAEYGEKHDVERGQYVLLAVSDSGTGMSPEVQQRAFDPFFTTKGLGRGSGLGLSMVYGFVKQSRGHVKIYSEAGTGTTIKLYLPRSTKETATAPPWATGVETQQGEGAMILVVEDDAPVRRVSVRFLQSLGYETMDCATAEEALLHLEADAPIDLLFTDVVLSGEMNGPELARRATTRRPGIAVLYTSGYTENAIVHQGRLDPGVQLVEKPFTRAPLAQQVHAALAAKRAASVTTRDEGKPD